MSSVKNFNFWVIFGFFVWLHLAYSLYPLPMQRTEQINTQAKDTVRNLKELSRDGVVNDKYNEYTVDDWKIKITNSYQNAWLVNFVLFLIGIISIYFQYHNYKMWPYYLCFASFIVFYYCFISTWAYTGSSSIDFFQFIKIILAAKDYTSIYWAIIWPIFLAMLFIYSIYIIITKMLPNN